MNLLINLTNALKIKELENVHPWRYVHSPQDLKLWLLVGPLATVKILDIPSIMNILDTVYLEARN